MAMVEMQTTAALAESRRKMQARRRLKNRIALTLSMATMAFGLFWLIWILMSTITRGIDGMSLALFTEMTPPPNTEGGGLANALAGSGLLILWATVFGTPLGIMAGIYLAEYGRKSWLAEVIRFINDILLSAPSIVVGLFVYTIVVAQMEHFSGWAGVIALALLQVPIVIRTTENMLKLVPDSLREAAYALGTPKWKMISAITLKASVSGIMTGILLAIARIAGETAPLLFTALSLFLPNVKNHVSAASADGKREHVKVREAFAFTLQNKTLILLGIGVGIANMGYTSMISWIPMFMVRIMGWTSTEVGAYMGPAYLITGLLITPFSGW